jgi:hypothetical protein
MRNDSQKLPQQDHARFAAVLLYARGSTSAAYAEERRSEAIARADAAAASYWAQVQQVLLAMLPVPCGGGPNCLRLARRRPRLSRVWAGSALGRDFGVAERRAGLAAVGRVSGPAACDMARPLGCAPRRSVGHRSSFRRFCGLRHMRRRPSAPPLSVSAPSWCAAVSRSGLVRRRHASARCPRVVVRTGTLVDATVISSASVSRDDEAKWAGHRRRKPVHGYKAPSPPTRRPG